MSQTSKEEEEEEGETEPSRMSISRAASFSSTSSSISSKSLKRPRLFKSRSTDSECWLKSGKRSSEEDDETVYDGKELEEEEEEEEDNVSDAVSVHDLMELIGRLLEERMLSLGEESTEEIREEANRFALAEVSKLSAKELKKLLVSNWTTNELDLGLLPAYLCDILPTYFSHSYPFFRRSIKWIFEEYWRYPSYDHWLPRPFALRILLPTPLVAS